jgi:hypothetical protein
MRKCLVSLALGLTLALGACANNPLSVISNPASLVTPQQKAQGAIDQANATIAAAAKTILDGVNSGVYTKDQARHYFDDLSQAAKYIDQAQGFVASGDVVSANNILKLEGSIVSAIQAELIKAKNGSK